MCRGGLFASGLTRSARPCLAVCRACLAVCTGIQERAMKKPALPCYTPTHAERTTFTAALNLAHQAPSVRCHATSTMARSFLRHTCCLSSISCSNCMYHKSSCVPLCVLCSLYTPRSCVCAQQRVAGRGERSAEFSIEFDFVNGELTTGAGVVCAGHAILCDTIPHHACHSSGVGSQRGFGQNRSRAWCDRCVSSGMCQSFPYSTLSRESTAPFPV